jgi:sec-independent protein translocase protein TatC
MLVAAVAMGVVAFLLKEPLFRVVLAPSQSDFFVYRWMGSEPFTLQLINTGLTEQFMIHLRVAFAVGVLAASPYIIYVLFLQRDRRLSTLVCSFSKTGAMVFLSKLRRLTRSVEWCMENGLWATAQVSD